MLKIHAFCNELGIGIGAAGNPEIITTDKATGVTVAIEIESQHWKAFVSACQRLAGVGIAPAGGVVDLAALRGAAAAAKDENGG